jgi:hypothetical protein
MKFSVDTVKKINWKSLRNMTDAQISKGLKRAGLKAAQIIKQRTSKGIGVEGKFKGYSPSYAKFRQEKGASLVPDLFLSGNMMGSMQVRTKDTRYAEIYFSNPEANKKAYWNNKTRPFFDLTSSEMETVIKAFRFTKI